MIHTWADGYAVEVDSTSTAARSDHVAAFPDAHIHQVWQNTSGWRPLQGASRLLLRRRQTVVAAAEVRLFTVPFTRRGIAYVRWGPLWRPRSSAPEPLVLQLVFRALHDEYVVRRGMVLRVAPRLTLEEASLYRMIGGAEDLSRLESPTPDRTLIMPLEGTLPELRKSLAQKWRNGLNKAEKLGLSVTGGTGLELLDEFSLVYKEMLQRKGLSPTADLDRHRAIQAQLPDTMKMQVLLARHEGRLCAGLIYSALGDTALYLFGATNESGMQTSASYLLQWEAVQRLKRAGITAYDLNGINPDLNPGTYHFKKGLAGKNGREFTFVGRFQGYRRTLTNRAVLALDGMRQRVRTSRAAERAPRHNDSRFSPDLRAEERIS